MFGEFIARLESLHEEITKTRTLFDFDGKSSKLKSLEDQQQQPDFWNNDERARVALQEMKALKTQVVPWRELEKEAVSHLELAQMLEEAGDEDESARREIEETTAKLEQRFQDLEFRRMMSDPQDISNCYLYIHPGAGGTESCDWADMLLRMYLRWSESKGFSTEFVDRQEGEEAGIRSATVHVVGEYAYGYLKAESGIHRLVRISPFDSNKRRHTSFASVFAYPEVDDTIEVEINDKDLKVDTYRSSGAGGQHVNKTDSAVRITHLPTGIVVTCQNERSQGKNRATAMKVLRARLYQLYLDRQKEEQDKLEANKKDISWGNQIRSYVFQPYQMVKDLRTGVETGNIQAVMNGELDSFIEAFLRAAK
ncbi:MAG: peptide chain release factor 2 [bacterium]